MKLKCKHCSYNWDYKGKSKFYATCPRCHYLIKVKLTGNKPPKTLKIKKAE
jgi:Zn finger protein HypA/HybF involved in hydrogenase expression